MDVKRCAARRPWSWSSEVIVQFSLQSERRSQHLSSKMKKFDDLFLEDDNISSMFHSLYMPRTRDTTMECIATMGGRRRRGDWLLSSAGWAGGRNLWSENTGSAARCWLYGSIGCLSQVAECHMLAATSSLIYFNLLYYFILYYYFFYIKSNTYNINSIHITNSQTSYFSVIYSKYILFLYFSNTTYAKVAWCHMKLEVGVRWLVKKI